VVSSLRVLSTVRNAGESFGAVLFDECLLMLYQSRCGNAIQLINGAKKLADDSTCNRACTGDGSINCGGSATLNIYKSPSI
jgi:hypothetical protein